LLLNFVIRYELKSKVKVFLLFNNAAMRCLKLTSFTIVRRKYGFHAGRAFCIMDTFILFFWILNHIELLRYIFYNNKSGTFAHNNDNN